MHTILHGLFSGTEKLTRRSWRSVFEHTRQLIKGLLLKVPLLVSALLTCEVGLASTDFVRKVYRLNKKSGLLFTAMYCKQCAVVLQRYYSGCWTRSDSLSVSISLTRTGLPRIIPTHIRKLIRNRDERADTWVRIYLSWFGISRLIALAPKVSKATFKSIVSPTSDMDSLKEVLSEMIHFYNILQPKYLPDLPKTPLMKGMSWEPTWKSTPLPDHFCLRYGLKAGTEENDRCRMKHRKDVNIFVNLKHEFIRLEY